MMFIFGITILFFYLNGEPVDMFYQESLIEVHRYEIPKTKIVQYGNDIYIEYDLKNKQ